MMLAQITELSLIGVYDRGVPNEERIVIYVNESVDLGQYGIFAGLKGEQDTAIPLRDNFLWFGNGVVNRGDWLFVYTGPGEPKAANVPNSSERIYSIHWGRSTTVFNDPNFVAMLVRMDGVSIERTRAALSSQV